jgi:hypothetical protein
VSRLPDDFGACAVTGTGEVVPTPTASVEGTVEAGDSLLSLVGTGIVAETEVCGEKSLSQTCVDISFIEDFLTTVE